MSEPANSLLLVAPDRLPAGLADALTAQGLWIEAVDPTFLAPALISASPLMVLCHAKHWSEVKAALDTLATRQSTFAFVLYENADEPSLPDPRVLGRALITEDVAVLQDRIVELINDFCDDGPATAPGSSLPGRTETSAYPRSWRASHHALSEQPRVSLRGRTDRLFPLRVALRDMDEKRARSVATALYRDGHEVRFVMRSIVDTPWQRLRNYAPHVLLLDEDSYQEETGIWLAAFRDDPHLAHTPLVSYPMAFLDRPEGIDLSPLCPRLGGLAKADRGLLNHLEPGRILELDLHQIGPTRLLRIAAESPYDVQIAASARHLTLHWGTREGHATNALLLGATETRLGPEEALQWLLDHPECSLLVSTRAHLALRPRVPVRELLARSHRDLPTPGENQTSTRPKVISLPPEAPVPSIVQHALDGEATIPAELPDSSAVAMASAGGPGGLSTARRDPTIRQSRGPAFSSAPAVASSAPAVASSVAHAPSFAAAASSSGSQPSFAAKAPSIPHDLLRPGSLCAPSPPPFLRSSAPPFSESRSQRPSQRPFVMQKDDTAVEQEKNRQQWLSLVKNG